MSVTIKVIDIGTSEFTIEAWSSSHKILKSQVRYRKRTKENIEAIIHKNCNVFNEPVWGGYHIEFLVDI